MADITDITTRPGQGQVALVNREYEAVHCLKVPLHELVALLPNAAVAEVIAFHEPDVVNDAPEWLLGHIQWRDRKVPLVSIESATGHDIVAKSGPRIAVLNTLNSNPKVPYIAVLMQGIPSLTVVKPGSIDWDESKQAETNASVAAYVMMDNETALVPNIDNLEERIEKLHV